MEDPEGLQHKVQEGCDPFLLHAFEVEDPARPPQERRYCTPLVIYSILVFVACVAGLAIWGYAAHQPSNAVHHPHKTTIPKSILQTNTTTSFAAEREKGSLATTTTTTTTTTATTTTTTTTTTTSTKTSSSTTTTTTSTSATTATTTSITVARKNENVADHPHAIPFHFSTKTTTTMEPRTHSRDSEGKVHARQCEESTGHSECWCVNDKGLEIPRTRGQPGPSEATCQKMRHLHAPSPVEHEAKTESGGITCFESENQRVVSIGDLHGDLAHTLELMKGLGLINDEEKWIGGTTILIQTGDVVDRGPDGHKLYLFLFRLQDEAAASGGQVVLLFGNHELMRMQGDLRYAWEGDDMVEEYGVGEGHEKAWAPDGILGREVRKRFKLLGFVADVIYMHGGLLPLIVNKYARSAGGLVVVDQINEEARRLFEMDQDGLQSSDSPLLGEDGPLWSREYAYGQEEHVCPMLDEVLLAVQARRMIVGHTAQESGNVLPRCHGRFLVGDTMMSQAFTNDPAVSAQNEAAIEFYGDSKLASAIYPQRATHCVPVPAVPNMEEGARIMGGDVNVL